MITKNYLFAGTVNAISNLILLAGIYFLVLKDFFTSNPVSGALEYLNQQYRPSDQQIYWAILFSTLSFGILITTTIKRSGTKTFISGLKFGFILGLLFLVATNFGLFSAQNIYSLSGIFVDLICSAFVMTIFAGISAWILVKCKVNDKQMWNANTIR